MGMDEHWDKIHDKQNELDTFIHNYWKHFSSFETWQFWVYMALLIAPLVVLYFTVDRRRIFELLFFGFAVHMLWAYMDIYLGRHNYLVHRYLLVPDMPFSVSVVASALPVSFILIYQYCTHHKKSYLLFMSMMSAVWAFAFAGLERMLGMLSLHNGMNQYALFLIDVAIGLIAFWMTLFFKRLALNPAVN